MPRFFRSVTSAAHGLIDFLGDARDLRLEVAVMVPVAVIKLNEPHAALGQPAGQQAVGRERAVGPLRAVQVEHVLRLVRNIDQLRHAGLHLERQLVLGDPRGDFRIARPRRLAAG